MRCFVKEAALFRFKNRIILISKSEIKLITSLRLKKYRNQYNLFVAEGEKIIRDLIESGLELHNLYTTETEEVSGMNGEVIDAKTLEKISSLKTANGWLAVFHIPKLPSLSNSGFTVALDAVRDPGNLGTIIRLCDWFGVEQLVCSEDTVDCFNPKVIQATMGSIGRVGVHYMDLNSFLRETTVPVYATLMEGTSVYETPFSENAILLMGSEAHGVSNESLQYCTHQITIPSFSKGTGPESLNVATATAILLSEFRRTIGR